MAIIETEITNNDMLINALFIFRYVLSMLFNNKLSFFDMQIKRI